MTSKRIAAVLSFALLVGTLQYQVPSSFAVVFTDSAKSPYKQAIEELQAKDVIEGYSDGTFKPLNKINRAEFLKIILEGSEGGQEKLGNKENVEDCFPDVSDQWFAMYVCAAKEEGIIGGYPDGTFKPEREINFVEAAKILSLAYEQDIQEGGENWFDGYVRAIESSRAIPQTVVQLDSDLTRGEMAEMMWRITEGKTEELSKGMLNLQYPTLKVNTASDAVQFASSCEDIRLLMDDAQGGFGMGWMGEGTGLMRTMTNGAPALMTVEDSAAGASMQKAAESYSETNVQVAGVDEADIVKTDGTYLYTYNAQDEFVAIVRISDLAEVARITTPYEDGFSPQNIYLADGRLVLIGNRWQAYPTPYPEPMPMMEKMIAPGYYPYQRSRTAVRIYDVSNASAPKLEREIAVDGSMVSSRRIGDALYLVTNQGFPYHILRDDAAPSEKDLVPLVSDSAFGEKDTPVSSCNKIGIIPGIPSPQYVIVSVIPLRDLKQEVATETVLGSAQNLFMSQENLYLADIRYDYTWHTNGIGISTEKTRLYRFAVEDDGVAFKAQGMVPGRILNQFSMDEYNDYFRIATTKGTIWEAAQATNNLYILNQDLEVTGSVEDIAPGEQIYSVRFMGDRAYMVTFKNTDPFFVIDVKDPRSPQILGKLKIPGYSDYLHSYDATHIIGFGKEAIDNKDQPGFAWYQGMKIAMFDVTDVADPKEMYKLTIGDRGTDSPLLRDHKALLFDRERNLLAFPIRVAEISEAQKVGNTGNAYGEPVFQGAYVFDVSLNDGFKIRGTVTHYDDDQWKKSGDYYYGYGRDIERIVRVGDALLTVSPWGVMKNDEQTVEEEGVMTFEKKPAVGVCPAMDDDSVRYISKDPETCITVRFACADGEDAFSNECGCGCR